MKKLLCTTLLVTALATPAFAQIQATTTTRHSDGTVTTSTETVNPALTVGKVVDAKENTVLNADGTATTIRQVTTETDAPAVRPAGVPLNAKARNVTTTTTSVTTPAGVAPAAGTLLLDNSATTSTSAQERTVTRVQQGNTEKVTVQGVETHSVR